MFQDLFHKVYLFGVKVANIGITPELGFHEKKKTQLLNIVVASGIPTNIFFCLNNLFHQKPVLALINLLILAGVFLSFSLTVTGNSWRPAWYLLFWPVFFFRRVPYCSEMAANISLLPTSSLLSFISTKKYTC